MPVKSPCIKICKYDKNELCEGCRRTKEEITNWMKYSDEEKKEVIKKCNNRLIEDDEFYGSFI